MKKIISLPQKWKKFQHFKRTLSIWNEACFHCGGLWGSWGLLTLLTEAELKLKVLFFSLRSVGYPVWLHCCAVLQTFWHGSALLVLKMKPQLLILDAQKETNFFCLIMVAVKLFFLLFSFYSNFSSLHSWICCTYFLVLLWNRWLSSSTN